MQMKIAVMNIALEAGGSLETVSNLIHDYREYVIGRMGMPYRVKNVCILSIALEAPKDVIAEFSRQIGEIDGAEVRTYYLGTLQKPE